ncbi:MAG: VacB/RNase II family 3'-5' exoribonuclease [Deltaproteobacteria bacterium]|nr:VacB/RNase II family 3'-5' exoribonuclease [Deltaproteobacteria bacterium]
MPETVAPERVFSVLSAAGRPLKAKDVCAELGLSADDRAPVRDALRALVHQGRVAQLEGKRFVVIGAAVSPGNEDRAARHTGGVAGVVQRKPSGIGWFIPDDKALKDAFVAPSELKATMDGDRVLARIERGTRGPTASIIRVVSRGRTAVTGLLRTSHDRRFGRSAWVEVDDNTLSGPVRILDDGPASTDPDIAADGDVVEVQIVSPPTAMHPATGRVLRRIGRRGELDTEIERLVVAAGVVRPFPPEALADAGRLGDDPDDDDIRDRLDLRDLAIVTIDGETAKDFDDAVYASQKRPGGPIDIVVCVADVSHYVTDGSALDREARRRSTSIYYPGRVIPMLPEALSNGLCSLKPRVPRLCAVARLVVDEDGAVSGERFDFGVMRSRARLTYSLVQRFLDEEDGVTEPYVVPPQPKEATATTAELDDEVRTSLRLLREAALRIRKNRQQRGSLDFELPELVIELDPRREPVGIKPLRRAFAHKLIEDLMIAANEASARFFAERGLPCVYRIHELPDEEKLGRFLGLAGPAYALATGRQLPKPLLDDPTQPVALMAVMNALGDHPSRQALDMLLLRSMKQARYSIDNVGHYGLGSTAYLHFTSPIRRYPDLIVHRLLRERLASKKASKKPKKRRAEDAEPVDALVSELEDIAASASETERKASDLERSIQALHACWLMKDRVGETHEAVVTGVSEAGAFVRLTELFVEGLVRIAELGPEYYAYDESRLLLRGERSGELITMGTRFIVAVAGVDMARRQIALVRPRDDDARGRGPARAPRRDPPWEPRTDARPHAAPGAQGRRALADDEARGAAPGRKDWRRRDDEAPHRGRGPGPDSRIRRRDGANGSGPPARPGDRHVAHRDGGHRDGGRRAVDADALEPRGRGRQARFALYAEDASAPARRDEAGPAHARHDLQRPTARGPVDHAVAGPRDEIDERLSRWRTVADDDRAITRDRRQRHYEQQQRGARERTDDARGPRPERARAPADGRPRLRGPEDLRALVEGDGRQRGRHDRDDRHERSDRHDRQQRQQRHEPPAAAATPTAPTPTAATSTTPAAKSAGAKPTPEAPKAPQRSAPTAWEPAPRARRPVKAAPSAKATTKPTTAAKKPAQATQKPAKKPAPAAKKPAPAAKKPAPAAKKPAPAAKKPAPAAKKPAPPAKKPAPPAKKPAPPAKKPAPPAKKPAPPAKKPAKATKKADGRSASGAKARPPKPPSARPAGR